MITMSCHEASVGSSSLSGEVHEVEGDLRERAEDGRSHEVLFEGRAPVHLTGGAPVGVVFEAIWAQSESCGARSASFLRKFSAVEDEGDRWRRAEASESGHGEELVRPDEATFELDLLLCAL